MRSLNEFFGKKFLIIVAHPDDETLWFFQSIQTLRQRNEVVILCMTHEPSSQRGMEIRSAAAKYEFGVLFGNCVDTGINSLLNESQVRNTLIDVFSTQKFDYVITHPPHGGEKPHPHHLQLYFLVKILSDRHKFKFAFFSERKILENRGPGSLFFLTFSRKIFVADRLRHAFKLLKYDKRRFSFLLKTMLNIFFSKDRYYGFEIEVEVTKKQKALLEYSSQLEVLTSYNAFYKKFEYLFIRAI